MTHPSMLPPHHRVQRKKRGGALTTNGLRGVAHCHAPWTGCYRLLPSLTWQACVDCTNPTLVSTLQSDMAEVSSFAANRCGDDPLLYTTPNGHVKKGYPNTDGVNNVLSADQFADKQLTFAR